MTETPVKLMRQSTIQSGDTCLMRLNYDISQPKEKGSEARAKGTAFHAGLEHLYRTGDINLGEMKLAASEALDKEVNKATDGFFWKTDQKTCETMLHKMLDYYVEKEKYWDLSEFIVVEVEWEFNYPFIGIINEEGATPLWLAHGTVDLILIGPDGYIYIVDHKTAGSKWRAGKEKARQTPQPVWYDAYVQKYWSETYPDDPRPSLFYFDITIQSMASSKVSFERRPATWSDHQKELIIQKAHQYARLVDEGGPFFPNQLHYLCHHEYCDHWNECPFGEQFNRSNV